MGEKTNASRSLMRKKLKETDRLENVDVDGRIILEWIFKQVGESVLWIDLIQSTDKR
jgi:hypothetical protein